MKKVNVEKITTLTGHADSVYTIERTSTPHLFFSAGGDGTVARWDLNESDWGELLVRVPASVYAIRYRPVVNQLWVGQNFEGIHVIDLESKKEIRSIKITTASIFDIQFWQDVALIGTGDGTLIVLDIASFTVKTPIRLSDKSVRCLAINPQTRELAAGYSDHQIRIFSLDNFQLKQTLTGHTNSVFTLAYSPDFRYLLSGSRDAHLKIWEVAGPYHLQHSIAAHMYAINHLAYTHDGKYFATCSLDKSIKIWDAETFRLLKVIDRGRHAGHGTSVNRLFWPEHSYRLVSCSDDRTLSVWDIRFE
jgi:WD40 repeat protein